MKKTCTAIRTESCPSGRKSTGNISTSSTDSMKKGNLWGGGLPDVLQSKTSSQSSSSAVQVGTLLKMLGQWGSITSNSFVLNTVKGNHLLLRCCPPSFHNCIWFNIKTAAAQLPLFRRRLMIYRPRVPLNQ